MPYLLSPAVGIFRKLYTTEICMLQWTSGKTRLDHFEKAPDSVGPCVIPCQMFVKSEFPLDSALVCDSD